MAAVTQEKAVVERHELITADELSDLREIDRLLDEANRHSLEGDGHCKSGEGYVSRVRYLRSRCHLPVRVARSTARANTGHRVCNVRFIR